jgi:hypothetical protein
MLDALPEIVKNHARAMCVSAHEFEKIDEVHRPSFAFV